MTFFMQRLAEVLGEELDSDDIPAPVLKPARPGARNAGIDRQIALRSLGEQLVSEANAVIQDQSNHLALIDEVGSTEELSFTITCGPHSARVVTVLQNDSAYGQIISDASPTGEAHLGAWPNEEAYELEGPDALPDLIIQLCVVAGLRNNESAHLI